MSPITTAIAALAATACTVGAQDLRITYTNNQPAGGMSTSPLWFAFHDGSVDTFNAGAPANPALETLAELGEGAALTANLGADGTAGWLFSPNALREFTPGETASATFTGANGALVRWFSFAAMVVPSNDFFIGNDNPTQYELFDSSGAFTGPLTIRIFSQDAWDARTEINNADLGAAFLVGRDVTQGDAESGNVTPLFSMGGNLLYLSRLLGERTPLYTMSDALTSGELLATITIDIVVPAPGAAASLGLALALVGARRRRA